MERKNEKEFFVSMKDYFRSRTMQRGENALSPEEADKAYAMIDKIEAVIKEMEASEEEMTADDIMNAVRKEVEQLAETLKEKKQVDEGNGDTGNTPAENYLRSTNALHDFAEALRTGLNGGSVKAVWGEHLAKNGITITSGDEFGYMPDYVVSRIEDTWKHKFEWLTSLKRVNAKRYAIRYQSTSQDSTSPDVRAKGHTAGNAKTDIALTMLAESLECQYIYARIKVDNLTIFNDDKGLIDYVIDAMATQMQYEIHRAVLVGDGRSGSSPDKINSIVSVARAASDSFVTLTTRDAANFSLIEDYRALVDSIDNEDGADIYLFCSKADLTALCQHVYATGGDIRYDSIEDIARQLGVSRIITTNLVGSDNQTYTYQAIALCPSKYVVIGEDAVAVNTWKDWDYNQTGYIMERAIAGAPEGMKMGAVMKVDPN